MKGLVAALVCLLFVACGGSSKPVAATPAPEIKVGKRAVLEDCASQSGGASFAASDPRNLVVGPLVMVPVGDRDAVRLLGRQRFLMLVMAGHTVTVRLAPEARTLAGLAYGRLRDGKVKLPDTYRSVTFAACDAADSRSDVDGADATLWSGYVLTRRPECIPLEVAIDGGAPQRVGVRLGAHCQPVGTGQ